MTFLTALAAVLVGFAAGVLSGMFGVGGGIVMTPGIQLFTGVAPVVALATPLPVILPTALMGAFTYRRAGQVDTRAAVWMIGPGIVGAVGGALLTGLVNTYLLLVVTAILLAYQAGGMLRTATSGPRSPRLGPTPMAFGGIGLAAGFISGLLGIGGGVVMVPLLSNWVGMPLKTVLGTSLLAIVVLVIPGTVVHAWLGHIDWAIFVAATIGSVPGARIGANRALGTKERSLRLIVGGFLMVVAFSYGLAEAVHLVRG